MPNKLFNITTAAIQVIILFYSFVKSLAQIHCLTTPKLSCPTYKALYLNLSDELMTKLVFASFAILVLMGILNLAQILKNKTLNIILIIAQVGLILFQQLFFEALANS